MSGRSQENLLQDVQRAFLKLFFNHPHPTPPLPSVPDSDKVDKHSRNEEEPEEGKVSFGSKEKKPASRLERSLASCTALFTYLTLDCLRFMVLLK